MQETGELDFITNNLNANPIIADPYSVKIGLTRHLENVGYLIDTLGVLHLCDHVVNSQTQGAITYSL